MMMRSEDEMEVAKLLREKKFWAASLLVAWAGGLQWHMMWLQKQDAFKEKFGPQSEEKDGGSDR